MHEEDGSHDVVSIIFCGLRRLIVGKIVREGQKVIGALLSLKKEQRRRRPLSGGCLNPKHRIFANVPVEKFCGGKD